MKRLTRFNKEELIVYEKTGGAIITWLLIGCVFIVMGISFARLPTHGEIPTAFGYFFAFFGVVLLLTLPNTYKKMVKQGGLVFLKATTTGLSISPTGLDAIDHPWSEVSQIFLTEKFTEKNCDGGETHDRKHSLIVYFQNRNQPAGKNWWEKVKQMKKEGIYKSPKNHDICVVCFPVQDMMCIKNELIRLSGRTIKVVTYKTSIFDHEEKTEVFEF
jgi:hypothetical protein